jgi:hypothetical protein
MTVEIPPGEKHPNWLNLEEIARIAKEAALKQGWHMPMVIVEGSKKSFGVALEGFPETHEGKARQMFSLGFFLARKGGVGELEQVFFISEGWMSIAEEGKPLEMRPSKDPKRKEVLVISSLSIKGCQGRMVIFEMIRDGEGHLADLRELQLPGEDGGGSMESPLLDAFVAGFRRGWGEGG